MENTLQQQQQQQQQLEETRKVMPLKIKRAQISGSITTPSPLLQRESREWKPSSQFFKPLASGKLFYYKISTCIYIFFIIHNGSENLKKSRLKKLAKSNKSIS